MSETLTIIQPEVTEQEIINALGQFANASMAVVGAENTHKTITVLTGLIQDSPDIYQKLFHPKTIKAIQGVFERAAKGNIGGMEMIGVMGELMQLFK